MVEKSDKTLGGWIGSLNMGTVLVAVVSATWFVSGWVRKLDDNSAVLANHEQVTTKQNETLATLSEITKSQQNRLEEHDGRIHTLEVRKP